ncbi:hypothetical protein [Tahibacter harae]|uniref:Uncharacterized protein n=1 Tax=Tahibacter harae TaxID=2963937 RepID=A0ABT1QV71_9GAMM|nr:hypothetical protein [Tahibacter harae]MCQ4166170.1 hypothetical protein [Tahibacter harae]
MAERISSGVKDAQSPLDGFLGNKVYGRLVTFTQRSPAPKLLRRRAGRCSEPLEKVREAYEAKSLWEKLLTEKDAWGYPKDQLGPRLFRQECEQWPDQISESILDEKQQRLNEHLNGKVPLPPEESLRLRHDLSLLNDIYRPGPRFEAALSDAEFAWLEERNLRFGNTLSMTLLGPLFGGPAAVTRVLGGTEQQVAAANQMGAVVLDLATAHAAMGRRAIEPATLYRQSYGLYIGPKRIYNYSPPLSSRHSIRSIRQGGVKKTKNTVAEPEIDMRADVEAINKGQGVRDGDFYTVNGRTYQRFDDHLVPHDGPGFHNLDRGEFDALGIFNRFGDTPQAMEIAIRVAGPEGASHALDVWRLGQ